MGENLRKKLETALSFHRDGEIESAIRLYREILDEHPETEVAWNYLGVALRSNGDMAGAIVAGVRAIEANPQDAEARSNLGNSYALNGDDAEAIVHYRIAVGLNPQYGEAWANLGHAANRLNDGDSAREGYRHAAELMAGNPPVLNDLGNALFDLADFDGALECYEHATKTNPGFFVAWNNMGNTLRHLHRLGGALKAYDKALEIDPDNGEAQNGRAQTLLLSGNMEAGWAAYESRFNKPDAPSRRRFDVPEWQGEDVNGRTILVYAEQGLGDTLQFIRFCPLLSIKGAKVVLEIPPQAEGLNYSLLNTQSIHIKGSPLPAFDVHIPLMSLPRYLGNLPTTLPYITIPTPEQFSGTAFRVGLVWAGNPDHVNDKNRSIALDTFKPLFDIPAIEWHSLQLGPERDEIAKLGFSERISDHATQIKDLGDTARTMGGLDLIISVDTAAAHLAGALGRPCWVLLPHLPDWRWLLGRDDSPWYPSLKLFRQTQHGDWGPVIADLKSSLSGTIRS